MPTDQEDALVIFGATGDLAQIETFPALIGLVERGVQTVPVVAVAKSGWGLDQFRDYAVASLKPLLTRTHVASIQITMAEDFDVADRGSFYDKTGASRDVIQNHMLQVLATVLADPRQDTVEAAWASGAAGTRRCGAGAALRQGKLGAGRGRRPGSGRRSLARSGGPAAP